MAILSLEDWYAQQRQRQEMRDPSARARNAQADESAYNYAYNQVAPEQQAYSQMVANQQAMLQGAQGVNRQIQNDPMDSIIRGELQKQLDSSGMERALFAQGTDMGAASNAQRAGQIISDVGRRGGNMNDPSVQAAMRQSQTQQQQDAQVARRDATLAGVQQRGQATNVAGGYMANRNNQLLQGNQAVTSALSMPVTPRPTQTVNATGRNPQAVQAGARAAHQSAAAPQVGYNTTRSPGVGYSDWQRQQQSMPRRF